MDSVELLERKMRDNPQLAISAIRDDSNHIISMVNTREGRETVSTQIDTLESAAQAMSGDFEQFMSLPENSELKSSIDKAYEDFTRANIEYYMAQHLASSSRQEDRNKFHSISKKRDTTLGILYRKKMIVDQAFARYQAQERIIRNVQNISLTSTPQRRNPVPKYVSRAMPRKTSNSIDEECPICKNIINSGEQLIYLECEHKFHESCLLEWFNNQNTCPMCRKCVTDEK